MVLFAVRYGIDLWIWLRSVLGSKGVAVLSIVISLANFGWYAVAVSILFVYNPYNGEIKSTIFLLTTGSGFTALFGGLLYWLASLTPLKKYMLRDRDDLEIV